MVSEKINRIKKTDWHLQLLEFPDHVIKVGLIFPRGQIIKNRVCISLQYLTTLEIANSWMFFLHQMSLLVVNYKDLRMASEQIRIIKRTGFCLQLPEFPGHVIKVGLIFPRGQTIKNGSASHYNIYHTWDCKFHECCMN